MRINDLKMLESKLFSWKNSGMVTDVKNVVICSGDSQQLELLRDNFKEANVISLDRGEWNLETVLPESVDLIIAADVFMGTSTPTKWLQALLKSSRYTVLVDSVVAHRGGPEGETSPSTGDVMRYSMEPLFKAKLTNAFDLNKFKKKIIDAEKFAYESNCRVIGYENTIMFIALFAGDLK